MKPSVHAWAAALAVALAAPTLPRANEPINPPDANWAGTTDIRWRGSPEAPVFPKRVGILAYCADLYHNAGDTGLQAGKKSVRNSGAKNALMALVGVGPDVGDTDHPWFLDGPFDSLGQYGAQNVADYFAYDDGIDRLRDVQVIDGDRELPTATQLIQNFDIVVAYTDNKCGQPIPPGIANSAGSALAGFVASPGKKLILTGFAFSNSIGIGNAIFGGGLSPLRKGGPGLAACSRDVQDGFGKPAPGPHRRLPCRLRAPGQPAGVLQRGRAVLPPPLRAQHRHHARHEQRRRRLLRAAEQRPRSHDLVVGHGPHAGLRRARREPLLQLQRHDGGRHPAERRRRPVRRHQPGAHHRRDQRLPAGREGRPEVLVRVHRRERAPVLLGRHQPVPELPVLPVIAAAGRRAVPARGAGSVRPRAAPSVSVGPPLRAEVKLRPSTRP